MTAQLTVILISLKALCLAEKQLFIGLSSLLMKLEAIAPINMDDKGNQTQLTYQHDLLIFTST